MNISDGCIYDQVIIPMIILPLWFGLLQSPVPGDYIIFVLFVCLFVCLSVCPHVFSKSIQGTELALST